MPTAHPSDLPSISQPYSHTLQKRKKPRTYRNWKPIAWTQPNSENKTRCSTWLKTSRRSKASTPTTWAASQISGWVQNQRLQPNIQQRRPKNRTTRMSREGCSWIHKAICTKYIKIKMTSNNQCINIVKLTIRTGKSKPIGSTRMQMDTCRIRMSTTRWDIMDRKKSRTFRTLEKMVQGDRVINLDSQLLLNRALSKRHGVQTNSRLDWPILRD